MGRTQSKRSVNLARAFEEGDASPVIKPPHSGQGHRSRLRARFERSGFKGFAEHEVLELLLTLCIPRKDVKAPARELLARFGSMRAVLDAPAESLRGVKGVGSVAPVALQIIREAATLYLQESAGAGQLLDSTDALRNLFRMRLGALRHEVFEVAYLDNAYRLIPGGIERLEEGLANRTRVYPAKVMRAALHKHAVFIVVAHNHPSGKLQVSPEDKRMTTKLIEAAQAVEIKLLDHIIVTPDDALSFVDKGLIPLP